MAKRGPSHSFNKQQKERKRLEKANQKNQRRIAKKQPAPGETDPAGDESIEDSAVDTTGVAMESQVESEPSASKNE